MLFFNSGTREGFVSLAVEKTWNFLNWEDKSKLLPTPYYSQSAPMKTRSYAISIETGLE